MTQTFTIPTELMDLNEYLRLQKIRVGKWSAGGDAMKDQVDIVRLYLRTAKPRLVPCKKPVDIIYRWCASSRRKDKSNIAFAKKFIEDALVDEGILPNDGWNNIIGFRDEFEIDTQKPRIEVTISYEE